MTVAGWLPRLESEANIGQVKAEDCSSSEELDVPDKGWRRGSVKLGNAPPSSQTGTHQKRPLKAD